MQHQDPTPSDPSLSAKLARLFGPEIEPHISLAPAMGEAQDSEIVSHLLRVDGDGERYELRGEIDRGGMGEVLEVWDRELRRPLAMKLALAGNGESATRGRHIARFLEEAQITAQLDHPGVVPVHELGVTEEGRVYFTMRRVHGRDLREIMRCVEFGLDGWNETRTLSVLLRVCEAVAFAHSRGVIHRDLKPANVMVGAFGEVYVMDWGLARVLGRDESPHVNESARDSMSTLRDDERSLSPISPLLTMQGDVLGTPAYMPPEQARGELDDLSPRSDVYSIGAMLYHLLAREAPYFPAGKNTTQLEALRSLTKGPPRQLSDARSKVAPELVAICERAMSFDAAERYPDVKALAEDLRAFLELRVVSTYETGTWAETRKWVRRNRSLAGALVATVLALLAGVITTTKQYNRAEESAVHAQREATRADGEAAAAKESERRALENEQLALSKTQAVLRLADAKRLENLLVEAETLWPTLPEREPAMEIWLGSARELLANLSVHSETLAGLRAQARPYDEESRRKDRDEHPRAAQYLETQQSMEALIEGLEQLDGDALLRSETRIGELEELALSLETELETRRSWEFDDPEDQWQHDLLTELVDGLTRLSLSDPVESAMASVEERLATSRSIQESTLASREAVAAWAWARAEIAQAAQYGGLELPPQLGLLPLGPDADSGLWEFSHLPSGHAVTRGEDGALVLNEDSGIVLVLIPAGRFSMGCQALDPDSAGYDRFANSEEERVHDVHLEAFFIAKHEVTQAQWQRAMGANPSLYGPHNYAPGWNRENAMATLMHPVEQVSWTDTNVMLQRLDLVMPTEAQWEYAARAGTTSVWWTGNDVVSLQGAANIADRYSRTTGTAVFPAFQEELDDGHTCHAPIGSYRANAFGLHDMAGNVFEWCGDGYGTYSTPPRPGDGFRAGSVSYVHPRRGGGWSLLAIEARSGARNPGAASAISDALGVRAARPVR